MRLKVLNIRDVAESQLCCGCGACAYADDSIEMIDALELGRRPSFTNGDGSPDAMRVCPGVGLEHREPDPETIDELRPLWGPVIKVWEGHAGDDEIRFKGSSGGAATALALYAIEQHGFHGLLHIDAREDVPYLNRTVLNTTRDAIVGATGSRYAPASPCEGLGMVEDAPGECVFIAKPCDIAASAKARAIRPALDEKLGLTIGIFCAGTPSTKGTIEMMRSMGVTDLGSVKSVRYRGNGWPGNATVIYDTPEGERTEQLTYAQSWGNILQKHRQWRCHVCADHSGEFADIAVGDPWYKPTGDNPGSSMIIARTARGVRMIEGAIEAGYLVAEETETSIIERSQMNLVRTRGALFGRLSTLALMLAPRPRYRNMPILRFWLRRLSLKEKLQSFYGTAKRVFRRRLRERVSYEAYDPESADRPESSAA